MSIFNYKNQSKLPNLQTSIFTIMSQLAKQHNAINLSQGFPNFSTDTALVNLVSKAMKDGHNQYAPMQGVYSLRKIISEKIESLYGMRYNPESEITITNGATQAIFGVISAFVNPNDEVIVIKPAYDCYEPAILANGGKPVFVQLKSKEYQMDWSVLKKAITPNTKMMIINSPHNPSGTILSEQDMRQLEDCVKNTNCIILSDEAYEHIVFDGLEHQSIAKYPNLASRSFICASFGKTFHITGWKMGYCVAPKALMKEFQKIHEFNVFCVNQPFQRALAVYLKEPSRYLELGGFFQKKRDLFLDGIKASKFKFRPSQGTYFQLLDYSDISNENDVDFAKRLVTDYGLASIPISVFNKDHIDHKQLRFCFAKTDDTLEKALEILHKI